jgi:acetylornithine deacetylase
MLEQNLRTAIMRAVDDGFAAETGFLAELVTYPSLRGAEHTAQDFMARAMRDRGLAVDHWQVDIDAIRHLPGFSPVAVSYDNAFNVVGAHRPDAVKGQSLILNGHIDVVPVGPLDMWTTPPFQPRIEDGWLYGRGGGDMKAGLAANLYALDALRRCGYVPAAPVYLQSVVEEECTGNGALACLARGYRADAALITEPSQNRLGTAQVGVLWFQVQVRGVPVHVAYAGTGANAIEAAYDIMQALHAMEERWNGPAQRHEAFAGHQHPINLNVGRIAGGDWASSVPAWCTFDVRVSIFPGQDIAAAKADIEATVRQAASRNRFLANNPPTIVYNGFEAEGYVLKGAEAPRAALADAHAAACGGALDGLVFTGTTDARFFGLYADIPGLVYGPRAESIHGFDERVDLDSVRRTTQAVALFIADWCGLNRA